LDIGTAPYPKAKKYQKPVEVESVSEAETSDDEEGSSEEE